MSTTNSENLNNTFDEIFIPKDLDDGVDETNLKGWGPITLKFWKVVPENYYLVRRNTITQKVSHIEGFGIKFLAPLFTKTILVPKNTGIKKFNNVVARTIEGSDTGVDLTIDFSVSMRISDPAKYINEGKHQIKQFESLIKSLLLNFISSIRYEDAIKFRGNLNEFDPDNKLVDFANRYGIKVETIFFEKVELPKDLKEALDNEQVARANKKAQEIENKTTLAKAQTDAEVTTVKTDAIKKVYTSLAVELMGKGFSQEDVIKALAMFITTQNNGINLNTIGANSSTMAGDLAAALIAAQKMAPNQPEQTNPNKLGRRPQ